MKIHESFQVRNHYAGIGSRETPEDIYFRLMTSSKKLAQKGFTLRSGGADGADKACETGAILGLGEREIYLPWKKFNGNASPLFNVSKEALKLAEEYHPTWERLSHGAKLLMGRNCYQVLGLSLNDPVEFILCWTKDGGATGGTGQALRIAEDWQIPVYNLFSMSDEDIWKDLGF